MTSSNETFSALLVLCVGNSSVSGEFPHKGQLHGALMFSLICACINGWVTNREAGDLRDHHAHYHCNVGHRPRRPDSNLHTKTNKPRYSALPIFLGHFSPNNSRKTVIYRPYGRDIDVFYEFEVWPKFDFCICVLYCVILYRDISCWYKATNKSNVFLRIPVMSMACCEGRRLSHIVNIG